MDSEAEMTAMLDRPAPAFDLPEARGGSYGLADALNGGSHALLVFLRHYG